MANSDGQVRIVIDTNAEGAAKALDDTSKSFDNTGKSAQRAASVFDAFQKEVNDNITSLREMALGGGQNTEEFKRLARATQETQKQLDLANKAVEKATGGISKQSSSLSGLISMGKNLVAGYVGIQGAIKAFHYAMESVDAFRVQERAINSLNTTLKNAGVYSVEFSSHLQELASEIQSFSNYGDEAVLKAVSIGQAFMGQTRITDELTKAVTDFASALDMDLEQAFTLVGKSIGSDTNALSRYGIELKKGMSDSEKMAAITKQLGDRYAGQAKQMADAGTQLKNSVGDLKEAFGGILDGYVRNWQGGMNKMVQATTRFVNSIKVMNSAVSNLSTSELEERYKKNADYLRTNQQLFERTIKNPAKLNSYAVKEYTRITAENSQILEQIKYLKGTAKAANKTPIKYSDDIGISASSGGASSGTAAKAKEIKNAFEQAQQKAQEAEKAFKLALYQSGGNITPQVLQAKQKLEDTKAVVDSVQKAYDSMTASGKSNFEQLNYNLEQAKLKIQDLASADVVDINAIRQAQQEYQTLQNKLVEVNSYFEKPKTHVEKLNQEIQKTTALLQELYFTKGIDSQEFLNAKSQLKEYQIELQNMNNAVTSNIGLNWQQIGQSIKSNLSSSILTPLREGESAFDRLGSIGLSIVQSIGQKLIDNAIEELFFSEKKQAVQTASLMTQTAELAVSKANTVEDVKQATATSAKATSETTSTLQETIQLTIAKARYNVEKAIAAIKSFFKIGATVTGFAAANGAVFENGKVLPFAKGGVVNQPTLFPMANGGTGLMGEAGAEAVMPLRRMSNGRLGVEADTDSQKGQVVNIYNYSGASVETRKRDDNSIDVFIRRVNDALANERTASGFRAAYSREDMKGLQAV